MARDRLDDVDLEATLDEPCCRDPGAAPNVQYSAWRSRQVSIEKFQRSDVFEARSSVDEQTRRLESKSGPTVAFDGSLMPGR